MFIKPFRIKSSTAIRGSDRRKLKQRAKEVFASLTQDEIDAMLPNKEEMSVVKILTHSELTVTCYTVKKSPVLFEYEGVLLPTVYTLWQFPHMVPSLRTWPLVMQKLRGGADLMLPGVVPQTTGLPEYNKGAVLAVSLVGNRAAVAVGVATVSSSDAILNSMRGKGVQIFHIYTDQLWLMGEQDHPPMLPEEDPIAGDEEDSSLSVQSHEVADAMGELQINQADALANDVLLPKTVEGGVKTEGNACAVEADTDGMHDNEDMAGEQKEAESSIDSVQLGETMDSLLINSFLQALLDAKKAPLPLLVSTFSGDYLKHACLDGKPVDVKKSSYKKLSKFMQQMQEKGIIQIKQLSKGVDSITAVSYQNEYFAEYKSSPFSARIKEERQRRAEGAKSQDPQGPIVEELFAVSAQTAPLFGAKRKGEAMTAGDVRSHITAYVKAEELSDPSNKKLVRIDPILADTLKSDAAGITTLPWDKLMTLILKKMNPCYQISIPGRETVFRKGKLEPIEVKVEQRMGNKKVTLIKNLELFGIDTKEFAQRLQQAAASSTSVSQLPGKNNPGNQVLVQGVQTKHITVILGSYNIPKKFVIGLDKIKSEKKPR